jgi:hypothetical protein
MARNVGIPQSARLTLFFLVFAGLALALPAKSAVADNKGAPSVTITIDDTAVSRLIQLIDAKDDSDASIDSWMALPANQELLKVGAAENDLTPEELRANVKAVIDGTATDQSQPRYSMSRVLLEPLDEYRKMLDDLHAHESEWLALCEARDTQFAPPGTHINQTVYLHVGGDWDAINRDGAIFINMAYFHDYYKPSWSGLDAIIAHETFHAVQNQVFGNPESQDTSDEAFITALSKIQREGTARFIEVDTDPGSYAPYTYGFFFRAVDNETLRNFPQDIPLLDTLYAACYPTLDKPKYADAVGAGLNNGGPYYDIGEGMVEAIYTYDHQNGLIDTVKKGPIAFFSRYIHLTDKHSELPKLPADVASAVHSLSKKK